MENRESALKQLECPGLNDSAANDPDSFEEQYPKNGRRKNAVTDCSDVQEKTYNNRDEWECSPKGKPKQGPNYNGQGVGYDCGPDMEYNNTGNRQSYNAVDDAKFRRDAAAGGDDYGGYYSGKNDSSGHMTKIKTSPLKMFEVPAPPDIELKMIELPPLPDPVFPPDAFTDEDVKQKPKKQSQKQPKKESAPEWKWDYSNNSNNNELPVYFTRSGGLPDIYFTKPNFCKPVTQPAQTQPTTKDDCKITDAEYQKAADEMGIDPAIMKAIEMTETKGAAFDKRTHKAKFLFERHYFRRLLKKKGIDPDKYSDTERYRDITKEGGYKRATADNKKIYKQEDLYAGEPLLSDRFARAKEINEDAAIMSTSWGKYQIMGDHYGMLYKTPKEMETAMNTSECEQFYFFVAFLKKTNGMIKALKALDFEEIARLYNGPDYKDNDYDTEIKKKYNKYKK